MNSFMYVLFTFFLSVVNCSDLNNCEKYMVGEFSYKMTNGELKQDVFISRTLTTQTEMLAGTDLYIKYSIKWIDSCTYDLRLLESNIEYPKSMDSIRWNSVIRTKIISSGVDYYIFQSNNIVTGKPFSDTIWIRNEQHKS